MVNSAYDWHAIQRLHPNMAAFRAVENRVTMVRAARGVSFAVGPLGSAIASSNSIAGDGLDMVGLVPVRSLPTVAGTEWGGWITVALATVLAALSALRASMRTQDGDDRPV
jgi:apolipoprotein N-acyltransferase